MRRRRGGAVLLALLAVILGLLVVADVTAKRLAEEELADRVRARVPEAGSTSASIHSFPFLPRLLASGRVAEVDAAVTDVTVRGLQFASIEVVLRGVELDRRQLVDQRRVVLQSIQFGRVTAEVTDDALSEAFGTPVTLEDGRASVSVRGRRVEAEVAVRDGELVVGGAGISLPGLNVVAPLLPCVANAEIGDGRVLLTCDVTEIPEELALFTDL